MLICQKKKGLNFKTNFCEVKKKYVFFFLLLINSCLYPQQKAIPPEKPRLILLLTTENFRFDYLNKFYNKLGDNGLKRLMNQGTFCKNAFYNYFFTQKLPGLATIVTGGQPSWHGIVTDDWYNQTTQKSIMACSDNSVKLLGKNVNSYQVSPKNLLTSTFSDEMALFFQKKSKIYSVALDPSSSVILGGHAADAAYFFESETGQMITNGYYIDSIPKWVEKFNKKGLPDTYLNRQWTTLFPDSLMWESDVDSSKYEKGFLKSGTVFPYDINQISLIDKKNRDYSVLPKTPFGNTLVHDFAIQLIISEELGKDNIPDFLAVDFDALGNIALYFGTSSKEMEDAVLRMDKEIGHLIDFVDSFLGLENVLLIFVPANGAMLPPENLSKYNLNAGRFKHLFSFSLLKSYLNAYYGKGEWVLKYDNQQIYLNHNLIEDSKLSLSEFQNKVADFISQFSGVSSCVTATTMQNNNFSTGVEAKIKNSYNRKRSGDIFINLMPYWMQDVSAVSVSNTPYVYDAHVPLFFYGWQTKIRTVETKVDITQIAPALSNILNIEIPNGAFDTPFMEFVK